MDTSVSNVAIITDSTSDLPAQILEQYPITVVPLNVTIDGQTWSDGVMSQEEFFQRMGTASVLPSTSQPSVGAFVDAYTEALKHAAEIVSIHISSDLSGTVESARAAAKEFVGRVHVFDSRNLSMGLGFQVIEAARAMADGLSTAAILERVHGARDRVEMLVGLDKLDNLVKGGRVGRVAGLLGGMLNLKVTMTVLDGSFEPIARTRGAKAALEHTVDWCAERMGERRKGAFCVMSAMASDRVQWLEDRLTERFEVTEFFSVNTGSVIAAHTGTGWGVAFLPEE